MDQLDWLLGLRFRSISKREHDWVVVFEQQAAIVVSCLWRRVDSGRIRLTSEDDGHQFGLPAPVDAAAEVNRVLSAAVVATVQLKPGILDLALHFSTGHTIEIIPMSGSYEAWDASNGHKRFIATGGGELVLLDDQP